MDVCKKLYEKGVIPESKYKNEAIKATFQYLTSQDYDILGTLGSGTYGLVAEIKSRCPLSRSSLAVKVVIEQDVTDSELNVWPKLCHPNVLEFRAWRHLPWAHTYMFFTEKCRTSLKVQLDNVDFLLDPKGLNRSIAWLRDIINGLAYIHDTNLCHLDLKCNNILISESGDAVICDFTFLSSAEDVTSNYGSPLIYRAPEAAVKFGGRPAVDGRKFDVWTLGLLAMELFTGNYFCKKASRWPDVSIVYWPKQIYSAIFSILRKTKFRMLVRKSFTMSAPSNAVVDNVLSFVISCLHLNPSNRPRVKELLGQKLFDGSEFCALEDSCVWFKKLSVTEIEELLKYYRLVSTYKGTVEENLKVIPPDCDVPAVQTDTIVEAAESFIEPPVEEVKTEPVVEGTFPGAVESEVEKEIFEKPLNFKQRLSLWAQKKRAKMYKFFGRFSRSK